MPCKSRFLTAEAAGIASLTQKILRRARTKRLQQVSKSSWMNTRRHTGRQNDHSIFLVRNRNSATHDLLGTEQDQQPSEGEISHGEGSGARIVQEPAYGVPVSGQVRQEFRFGTG